MASAYKYDDSVAKGVQGLIAQNSPLMRQAEQRGMNTANKRGLLNSSIAIGSAQGAVLDRAVPIATADAQMANNKNLQQADIGAQRARQQADIAAQMSRLTTQAGFNKELAGMDIGAQMDRLRYATDADMNRLQFSTAADMEQQVVANNAEMARLQASMANANGQQRTEIEARMLELETQNAARLQEIDAQGSTASRLQSEANTQQLQRMSAEFGQQMQVLERQNGDALEQIQASGDQDMRRTSATIQASMAELQANLASGDRQRALDSATNMHVSSQQLIASIMQNPEIPASERARWINFAQQQAGIGLNIVEQIQNVDLSYGQSAGTVPAATQAAAPSGLLPPRAAPQPTVGRRP